MDRERLPRRVVLAVLLLLLVVWLAVYAVDGAAWFGRPPVIGETPIYLWQILFPNGPIEWLQWVGLAAGAVLSTYLGGRLREQEPDDDAWRFWTLFGVGLAILLLEDSGDMRHVLVAWGINAAGPTIGPLPTRLAIEGPYLVAMVLPIVLAVVRYGHIVLSPSPTRKFLIGGIGFYAVAAMSHAPVSGVQDRVGRAVNQVLAGGQMAVPEDRAPESLPSALADGPVEETLELIAVACLLALTLAFWNMRFPRREAQ